MSSWATTIISGLVLVVAFMQWRTAHQKVLLDLFEKRLLVYEKVRSALDAMASPTPKFVEAHTLLVEAYDASVFLFGSDVQRFIDRLWTANQVFADLSYKKSAGLATPEDDQLHDKLAEETSSGYIEASRVFAPYMRMDQTRVRTPGEWLADRNRLRLSHADEKQR